ncbi:hypothetical protein CFC21_006419 [Triticum aestivum]|uniref:Uncharacterized protein n=3 Tax=Triticum TaxID=4564 RepID=A0A9R0QRI1_TRITD|nr:uncharacterized protein LOC123090642 [Triticum aestivum]KAF6989021.1 hypothetical protein CFC21_006419 [Triticum aestivum]VAH16340.1 unnamed protein product [Triticum turgidum subsp. durum]
MEMARAFFHTPQRQHHLAELRIEGDQSPVAFSDPCAAGRKRRCLFPAFSPRKKMLVDLPPFSSAPAPSPPPSAGRTVSAFSSALSPSSGSNGSFAFCALPEQPSPEGSNRSGAFAFLTSPERSLTPMGSTASSGFGVFSSRPSLSPGHGSSNGTGAIASLAPPTPTRTGSNGNDGGEPAFLASPNPALGRKDSSASAADKVLSPAGPRISGGGDFVISPPLFLPASRTSASPGRKPEGSTLWSRRRGNKRQLEEQLQVTVPLKKVAKTEALAIGDPTRRAALSVSSTRPCCAFVNSPAKAINQEANKDILAASGASCSSSPHQSPAGKICTFGTSPTRPLEKASRRESEGGGGHGAAACPGAELVVRVTCSCGARKEFCFDHRH